MNRRQRVAEIGRLGPLVLPSMLRCDFGHLQREIRELEAAGVKALHLDVMDGNFVPNLSYGLTLVEAIRKMTDLLLDVHLMIVKPESYVQRYYEAGADVITFHIEATTHPRDVLLAIRELDAAAGVALNPDTPIEAIEPYLDLCDLVLVMSVMPGFGGQQFERVALDKLEKIRAGADDNLILAVDGGVKDDNISECAAAGANWFVVGSAIFNHEDYPDRISTLTNLVSSS